MKNTTLWIISIIACLALIVSCSTRPEQTQRDAPQTQQTMLFHDDTQTPQSDAQVKKLSLQNSKELFFENFSKSTNVLFMEGSKILYSSELKSYGDISDLGFYMYDMFTDESVLITQITGWYISSENIANIGNYVYYPFSKYEDDGSLWDYILKVSIDTLEYEEIKFSETDTPLIFLTSSRDAIFRTYLTSIFTDEGEKTEYCIDNITDGSPSEHVIKTEYTRLKNGGGYGEIMPFSCVRNDYIYTYSIKSEGTADTCFISQYTLDGRKLNSYPLDIEASFLYMEEVNDYDIVFGIDSIRDYFLLGSLNNRICILKLNNNRLEMVDVPEELLGVATGGRLMDHSRSERESVYIIDYVASHDTFTERLCVFNTGDQTFQFFDIDIDEQLSIIQQDSKGNLIVSLEKGENDIVFRYVEIK